MKGSRKSEFANFCWKILVCAKDFFMPMNAPTDFYSTSSATLTCRHCVWHTNDVILLRAVSVRKTKKLQSSFNWRTLHAMHLLWFKGLHFLKTHVSIVVAIWETGRPAIFQMANCTHVDGLYICNSGRVFEKSKGRLSANEKLQHPLRYDGENM